jgi:hypothetical protein
VAARQWNCPQGKEPEFTLDKRKEESDGVFKCGIESKGTFIETNGITFIIDLFFIIFSVLAFRGIKVSERRKPTIAYRQKRK